jgi:hypothetical protein
LFALEVKIEFESSPAAVILVSLVVASVVAALVVEGLSAPSPRGQLLPLGRSLWQHVVEPARLFQAGPYMLKSQHGDADAIAPQLFPQDLDGTLVLSRCSIQMYCPQRGGRKCIGTQKIQGSLQTWWRDEIGRNAGIPSNRPNEYSFEVVM